MNEKNSNEKLLVKVSKLYNIYMKFNTLVGDNTYNYAYNCSYLWYVELWSFVLYTLSLGFKDDSWKNIYDVNFINTKQNTLKH
jgi:hypothetical protein